MKPRTVARAVRAVKGQVRARWSVEERRRQLIDLGLGLFSARPYDEISMEEIARASGVSKGLVFHYFPTKRDLYVAALEEASRLLLAQTETDPALPAEEQLRLGLDAYLGFVARRARAYVALMRGGIGSDPEVARVLEGTRQEIIERILKDLGIRPAGGRAARSAARLGGVRGGHQPRLGPAQGPEPRGATRALCRGPGLPAARKGDMKRSMGALVTILAATMGVACGSGSGGGTGTPGAANGGRPCWGTPTLPRRWSSTRGPSTPWRAAWASPRVRWSTSPSCDATLSIAEVTGGEIDPTFAGGVSLTMNAEGSRHLDPMPLRITW